MSSQQKAFVNKAVDGIVIVAAAVITVKLLSMVSKSLPRPKLIFTPYDIGMNILHISVGRLACSSLQSVGVHPLVKL